MRKLCHQSYLVKTTAGAVYQHTRKHLRERQVSKPELEPPSADLDVSTTCPSTTETCVESCTSCYTTAPDQQLPSAPSQVHHYIAPMLRAALKQCKASTEAKVQFQCHPVCQPPKFLLVLLVTPQWYLANQATPTVPQNA